MKQLYALIRIPKSGSQTLEQMVCNSLPESRLFQIPHLPHYKASNLSQKFRWNRTLFKRIFLPYGVMSEEKMWPVIEKRAKDKDIISGHISYGRAQMAHAELRYITLIRNPIDHAISSYNYSRKRYQERSPVRRSYLKGIDEKAGTGSFLEYLQYQHKIGIRNPQTAFITGTPTHPDLYHFLQKNFFHHGLLEYLDLFADQLAEKTGHPIHATWKNKTPNQAKPELNNLELEILNEMLSGDILLYQKIEKDYLSQNH